MNPKTKLPLLGAVVASSLFAMPAQAGKRDVKHDARFEENAIAIETLAHDDKAHIATAELALAKNWLDDAQALSHRKRVKKKQKRAIERSLERVAKMRALIEVLLELDAANASADAAMQEVRAVKSQADETQTRIDQLNKETDKIGASS